MNKISRLTALLLALMMIFSTFAAAETAYSVGGMTMEQWEQLVEQAEDNLYTIDEGDAGKTITPESPEQAERGDYYPYSDGVAAELADEAVSCQISPSGVAILTNPSAGQWQMKVGSIWVNIAGETGSTLAVTGAMMNGMTTAEVRKALEPKDENGAYTAHTAVTTVEIVEISNFELFNVSRSGGDAADNNGDIAMPLSLQRANDGTTYTVVIDYVFEDGTTAAASWGASLGAGTDLNQVIQNPNVVGYKPMATLTVNPAGYAGITYTPATVATANDDVNNVKVGDVTDPGSVNLAIDGIDQHITVTVTYEPTLVDYTVIHRQQNTDNDGYTEYERVTRRGLTGSIVPDEDVAHSYDGFYNLLYEQPTIAANGSTVVEISYDRYYYLISFELGGGYGVDPVYGRYGSEVGEVPDPIRPGYEFLGWNVEVPDTIPADHMVITALWKPVGNFYTVVYWTKNVDDEGYSYWGQQSVASVSGTSLIPSEVGEVNSAAKAGLDKAGYFKYDADATAELNDDDKAVIVAGDGSTVVNVYYSRNSYTIRFIYARQEGGTYVLADLTGCGTYNNEHPSNANHNLVKTSWGSYKVYSAPVVNPAFADKTGSFKEGNYTYHYIYITAKYGENLENIWPAAPLPKTDSYYFGSWGAQCGSPYRETYGNEHANIVGAYPVMSEELIMDPANPIAQTMVAWWAQSNANVSAHTYHIYFEALPGQESEKEDNGVDYVHVSDIDFTCAHNGTTRVDPFDYAGFTCVNDTRDTGNDKQSNSSSYYHNDDCPNDGRNNQCAYCNVFYYKRDRYTLSFYNFNNESEKPADETLMFGESFSEYKPTDDPAYPEGAEPGALTFVGWYTTPEAYEGTEVDWNSTMPEGNVTLYAKWVPKTYTVRFFLTEDLMETGLDVNAYMPTMDLDYEKAAIFRDVPHGDQIDQEFVDNYLDYNAMTQNGGPFQPYTFIAWFYYDENGVKQPFEPATQIKQNLDVFAEWSSNVLVPYTIRYAVPKIENGVRVVDYYVATETTGSALAGTSKTFEAKGGADLYADYQTGCFPETESHTLRFETEDAAAGVEYIFWYTDEVKVPYKVFYVTAQQNDDNSLTVETIPGVAGTYYRLEAPKSVDDNENAVVTETFKTIPGYMPDAYQKRLIVTNDGNPDNDVIIFIYTKDEQHAYYRVTHYIENLDTDAAGNTTWTEYTSSQFVGDIGKTKEYNNDPLTISGFAYSAQEYVVKDVVTPGDPDNKATLTADGMQINLYYERKVYPYKVQYLLENTTTVLAPEKIGEAKYEDTVTEYALDITNYVLVSADPQSLTIRIEEDREGNILTNPTLNIITFYYREKTVTINYQAVCPDDPAAQNFGSVAPETEELSILSGMAKGSTAAAGENYTFVGWYDNEACSGEALTTEAKYVPTKADGTAWPESTTYYAKFEENEVTLKYAVVKGCEAMGTVAPTEETLKVLSGKAVGSKATAGEHYKFVGWYDNEQGSGTAVATTEQFVPTKGENEPWPEGKTWYAKFEEKQAMITYVAVGNGTVNPESETLNVVTGVAKGSTATAATNHHFVGWYTDADCKVPVDSSWVTEGKITPVKADGTVWPASTTYYAKFEENEVTLKYAVVTGCEAMGTVEPTEETLKVLSGKAVGSKATAGENYKFVGWYDNEQGSGTAVATTEQFVPTKGENEAWPDGKTWYAKFEEKQATITYVAVGNGTVAPENETLNVVTGVAKGSTATAATNHHVVGWYTDADCKVPVAESWVTEGKITPVKADGTAWPESTTYYAKFEENEVTINYVAALRADGTVTVENGTGGLVDLNDSVDAGEIKTYEDVKVSTGTAVGATAEPNVNYKFVGWYDNAACSGEALSTNASYAPGKTNGLNTAATYYALFELDVADLVIEKTVNGEENPPIDPFELTISLPDGVYNYTSKQGAVTVEGVLTVSGGTGAMVIRDGEKITIHDIAIGSAYAVAEADLPWFDEVIEASGTQIAAENNRVTIANTYRTGTLTVKKVVVVQAGVAAPSADTEFTFEVELKNAPLGGSVAVSIDNAEPQSMPLINGKLTFKLKDGQMAKIEDLPRGTDYVVTEVNVPDNFVVSYDGMEAGKIDGDVITTVTNNYPERYADLTVTKSGLQKSKESAVIDVVVTTNGASQTYTLVLNQANPSATITGIPVGSNYTVTERDAWTWQYKDTTAQRGTIVDGGSTVTVANIAEGDKWLHDESYLVNNINTGTKSGVND